MKKFSVPFLYLIFFILSFFNWFNNFLNDKKTFLFVFFLACALAIMIVETILFRKFTFKKFLSLIFFILFILSIKEARGVFIYLDLSFLERYSFLFLTLFNFFNIIQYDKCDLVNIELLLTSIFYIIFPNNSLIISIYLISYITLILLKKEYTKRNILFTTNILFSLINIYHPLFGYNFLFCSFLLFYRYRNIYHEYKELNIKENLYNELNQKMKKIKEETLKTQIRPHFLFNSLTMIDVLYLKDYKKGVRAINKLNELMDKSNKILQKEYISFPLELDIIDDYVSLMNEKENNPFVIKKEINIKDFAIPPLSIEPIIENSIKYSKVNTKENGYILIKTCLVDDNINIIIKDNGIGFDPNVIKNTSISLKNLINRFSLLENGNVIISSKRNEYTEVNIIFKYQPIKKM